MKKALSIALVGTLSVVLFLVVGYAQEETPVPELLDQELASMEAVFTDLQSFLSELITEVKGNMDDIDQFNGRVDELKDVVQAVSIEIKAAEGKIVGLRDDVDAMADVQQETQVRLVALESGLSELSASLDECCSRLETEIGGTKDDLAGLTDQVAALIAEYNAFKDEYASFRESFVADLDAVQERVQALEDEEIGAFKAETFASISALQQGQNDLFGRTQALEDEEIGAFKEATYADISSLKKGHEDLTGRVQKLEDEDVGTFKKKVLELERAMSALSIKIDNNRAKLEGFDQAIASLATDIESNKNGILANMNLLEDQEARIAALEGGTQLEALEAQVNTLYFISIVALLTGVGALVWGFLSS
jgi:chromosome segregation ATPase